MNRLHENMRAFCDLLIAQRRLKNELPLGSSADHEEFVIVTGADTSHYKPLLRLLFSIEIHEPHATVIVYDLGISKDELDLLQKYFPKVDIRYFDYTVYPAYFNIKVKNGEYAWKPVIINEVAKQFDGYVAWLDAGNLIVKPFNRIRDCSRNSVSIPT